MNCQIILPRMRFDARHGVFEAEHREDHPFEVDLTLTLTGMEQALLQDKLEATADYAQVWQVVREVMSVPSALLERVAWRICQAVYQHFPMVCAVEATVKKCHPPVREARWDGAAVRLSTTRSEMQDAGCLFDA